MTTTYPSVLTNDQWAILEPHVPAAKHGGSHRKVNIRRVVNGILYRNKAGCQWRILPKDYPPWETVYYYFAQWRDDGTLRRIHDCLREGVRLLAERQSSPSAGSTAANAISP